MKSYYISKALLFCLISMLACLNICAGQGRQSNTLEVKSGFTCHCGKAFSCQSGLRRHKSTHSDLKPYICSVCGQDFKQKVNMNRHFNAKHKMRTGPVPKKYKCDTCGHKASQSCNMQTHIRKMHINGTFTKLSTNESKAVVAPLLGQSTAPEAGQSSYGAHAGESLYLTRSVVAGLKRDLSHFELTAKGLLEKKKRRRTVPAGPIELAEKALLERKKRKRTVPSSSRSSLAIAHILEDLSKF